MTYIIAEPCIDIKDLSCVDVCPVDCIHVFERILIIDPEECIDCFAPSEQLVTAHGLRTFAELENKSTSVLTDCRLQAGFREAVPSPAARRDRVRARVRGARPLRRLEADDSEHLADFRRTVSATPTHRWLLSDGDTTSSLSAGQFVPAATAQPKRDSETYRLGVLHGLVYGDGSWNKQEIRSESTSTTSSSMASESRSTGTSSIRSTSRRVSTRIRGMPEPASCGRAPTSNACFRRLRMPSTSQASSTAGWRQTATLSKLDHGACVRPITKPSTGSSRRRRSPATSRWAQVKREASRRTSASAAGRSAGSTWRRGRRTGES